MPNTLNADVAASIRWVLNEELDLSTVSDSSKLDFAVSLADGSGNNQVDAIWHDERTVAGGAQDDLDLSNLTRTLFGAAVSVALARVKAILIVNRSTAPGDDLTIGAAPANAFAGPFDGSATAKVVCGADSALVLCKKVDGWDVTGTSKILRIDNPQAGAITYRIVILGVSS